MKRIFNFIIKNGNRLLFLSLLGISLALTIQSHSYHTSKFIGAVEFVGDGVHGKIDTIGNYMGLAEKNDSLAEENAKLLRILFNKENKNEVIKIDSVFGIGPKNVVISKVISNSYDLHENYIIINTGRKAGINVDMGVINDLGVVGVIDKVSPNFAKLASILNNKSLINAKIKNSNLIGTISWNGKSTGFVQLSDITRGVSIKKGDTIVTGGLSEIFPENIDIGTIDKMETSNSSFMIHVKLFNDMTNLGYVYIIKSKKTQETLQKK
ncbi:rod shape-determining protein MreC [Flavobacterium sp. 9]|uniref:rod shape-determining protein MreC n=1 Tax=Flavobacterium sp. 9 TaxID=2035198 RepID=UPI000C183A73|nr:rod shape-determining protein MreC [Flavobacterium sp. 9]PIF30078.1 rod shape-determining protein MreC [Flavobacterium sp. 9]